MLGVSRDMSAFKGYLWFQGIRGVLRDLISGRYHGFIRYHSF